MVAFFILIIIVAKYNFSHQKLEKLINLLFAAKTRKLLTVHEFQKIISTVYLIINVEINLICQGR